MRKKHTIIFIFIFALIFSGCSQKKVDNERIKINNNEKITSIQKNEIFTFKNKSIIFVNNISVISVSIINNTDETQSIKKIEIVIKDDNNKYITLYPFLEKDKIEAKSTYNLTTTYPKDLTTAKDIEFKIIK